MGRNKLPTNTKPRNSMITDFFVERKNDISNISTDDAVNNQVTEFYNVCVEETIEVSLNCQSNSCYVEKAALKEKLEHTKSELSKTKRGYDKVLELILDKDEKIKKMRAKLAKLTPTHPNNNSSREKKSSSEAQSTSSSLPFVKFMGPLTEQQLAHLRSIGMSYSEDSTFVLETMRYLYAANLSELCNLTVKGKGKSGLKVPMSDEKKKVVTEMYTERMQSLAEAEQITRTKRINRLIARAITNISPKQQTSEIEIHQENLPEVEVQTNNK